MTPSCAVCGDVFWLAITAEAQKQKNEGNENNDPAIEL
jgi:hypothetical protein